MKILLVLLSGMCCMLSWAVPASSQSLETLTEAIQPEVVLLRELAFLHDIEVAFQSPAELRQVLEREIERTYPGNTLQILEKRLLKFGFIVSPINLEHLLTQLFSQQIAGYYDPIEKKMVLIRGEKTASQISLFPTELLSHILAQSMGVSLENILLAHELTHVLQDQHFNLMALPFEDLRQEDMASAVKALIEGDATLVMIDYILQQQQAELDATEVPGIAESMQNWSNNPLIRSFGLFQTAPRYIMENVLFSYLQGFEFALRLKKEGDWERINHAYTDYPVSTEQILHPEKYLEERDWPTIIELPDFAERFSDWRTLEQNTLGEFNISLLLDGFLPQVQARRAAAGWDGDRFGLYEQAVTGKLFLAWYTTWDSAEEAQEFFQIYAAMLAKRYAENIKSENSASSHQWKTDSGELFLEIRGSNVLLLDGSPEYLLKEMTDLFWGSTMSDF